MVFYIVEKVVTSGTRRVCYRVVFFVSDTETRRSNTERREKGEITRSWKEKVRSRSERSGSDQSS